MWINYGRIFAEYMFIKKFRISNDFQIKLNNKNQEILKKLKN